MRAEPFIDGDGGSHERERAAYRLVTDRDGCLSCFCRPSPAIGSPCLEFARILGQLS